MKRKAGALVLLAALGGCVSADKTGPQQQQQPGPFGGVARAIEVRGVQGPYGEPVPVTTAKPMPPPPAGAPKKDGVVQAGYTAPAGPKKDDKVVPAAAWHIKKGETPGVYDAPPGAVAAVGALPGI